MAFENLQSIVESHQELSQGLSWEQLQPLEEGKLHQQMQPFAAAESSASGWQVGQKTASAEESFHAFLSKKALSSTDSRLTGSGSALAQGMPASRLRDITSVETKLAVADARNLNATLARFGDLQSSDANKMAQWLSGTTNSQPSFATIDTLKIKEAELGRSQNSLNSFAYQVLSPLGLYPENTGAIETAFTQSLSTITSELSAPVKGFFQFIAHGEQQLYGLQHALSLVNQSGEAIPSGMLLQLQLKMTHVSQQLELFTSMLNKGLEATKTLGNTQI